MLSTNKLYNCGNFKLRPQCWICVFEASYSFTRNINKLANAMIKPCGIL